MSQLPFASEFQLIPKRCLSSFADTGLMDKLLARTDLRRLVFVGDCTDLCIYHGAMAAQMAVNCHKLPWEVIVVSSLVDTMIYRSRWLSKSELCLTLGILCRHSSFTTCTERHQNRE